MSDAIRDVTIRVRIQQVETQLQPPDFSAWLQGLAQVKAQALDVGMQVQSMMTPPATFAEQAAGFQSIADQVNAVGISAEKVAAVDPFANLDGSIAKLNGELQQQAGTLNTVEQAATRNFDALLNQAQAETALEQATQRATASQRAQSIETINGAGNALRAAAASNSVSGVVTSLGQAFLFTVRAAAQQTAGNVAVATSATAAANASEYQAVAVGHVSAAGARAATSNAALAASNAAVAASSRGAAGMMAGLAGALPQVAIGVAVVSLAVELGSRAWAAYGEASQSSSDKIKESVNQRLEAEKQSAQVEAALDEERRKRMGWQLQMIDELTEKRRQYNAVQSQIQGQRDSSFASLLSLESSDPNFQLQQLRNRSYAGEEDALRRAGQDRSGRTVFGFGSGSLSSGDIDAASKRVAGQAGLMAGRTGGDDLLDLRNRELDVQNNLLSIQQKKRKDQETELQILRQQFQTEQQQQQSAKARLATIQETIAAEQGRLTSAAERFAQMDPGEQARLKEVALKSKNGGELTLQEAQLLSQSGLGQGQASQAFQRIADKAGFQQVAGNLGEFNQIEQLRFQGQGAAEAVKTANEQVRNKQKEITDATRSLVELVDSVETIFTEVVTLAAKVDDLNTKINQGKLANRDTSPVGSFGNRKS